MRAGEAADEVPAIIRLRGNAPLPPGVRQVARFGEIATVRLPRGQIPRVREEEGVGSLKAPSPVIPEPARPGRSRDQGVEAGEPRRPDVPETGRGVVIAVGDWGFDFAHPDFRNEDGSTRITTLWDQRSRPGTVPPQPYGYGVVYTREAIDRALRAADPYAALGYHPADADSGGTGAHGTHVLSLAAGNGRAGGPVGVAPEAELVLVHMDTRGSNGSGNLGDSVTLLEAVDFVRRTAGEKPWVLNLSMGRHAGPHDGLTLVEQGLDAALEDPGCAIVQSTGNYYDASAHATGELRPGETQTIEWEVDEADVTPNELELWYPTRDRLVVEIIFPDGTRSGLVHQGEQRELRAGRRVVGRVYHRANDPNNLDHMVDIFLDAHAPAGTWRVRVTGEAVVDGRWHAWVERDAACAGCQSRFRPETAVRQTTIGTICNAFQTLAIGAYDPASPSRELARFSSSGPTRDGRQKPDLVAPGVSILGARSAPRGGGESLLTRKSGTSMAAPHVTGTIALMFEAAGRPLEIHETRRLLLTSTVLIPPEQRAERRRIGSGYLDSAAAVRAVREFGALRPTQGAPAPPRRPHPRTREAAEVFTSTRDEGVPCGFEAESAWAAGPVSTVGTSPTVAVPRIFTPPTETVHAVDVDVRTRIVPEPISGCVVALPTAPGAPSATTAHTGRATLSLVGVPNGTYRMTFTPPQVDNAPVGPATASATPRPARVWRALELAVTVRHGRATGVGTGAALVGGVVRARIQPVWMQSPNRHARRGDPAVLNTIVVHHTGGSRASSAIRTFLTAGGNSAHYLVDVDGQIVKMVHEDDTAFHAGASHWGGRDSVNEFSVGIEIVNATGAYPAAQTAAVLDLLQRIRAGVPTIFARNVVGHSDIATCPAPGCTGTTPRQLGRKSSDPGVEFDWPQVEALGLGLVPHPTRTLQAADYQGYFTATPVPPPLRRGDSDTRQVYGGARRLVIPSGVVAELQQDLRAIGYWCPDTGSFDAPTEKAVMVFHEHFFSGSRPRAASRPRVNAATAEMIKRVRP